MGNNNYTELQLKIINGEIPLKTVPGNVLPAFYKKAVANGELELAEQIKERLAELRLEATERARIRSRNRKEKKRRGEFVWKQPASNEYTEHQKKIVDGEIPFEKVHTKELISIHLKAQNRGNRELAEKVLDIIHLREKAAEKRNRLGKKAYYYNSKKKGSSEQINLGTSLTIFEQAILMGIVDLDECTVEHLEHILAVAESENNEFAIIFAKSLLEHKKGPKSIYITRDHRKAIDVIEALLQLPIKRPAKWNE